MNSSIPGAEKTKTVLIASVPMLVTDIQVLAAKFKRWLGRFTLAIENHDPKRKDAGRTPANHAEHVRRARNRTSAVSESRFRAVLQDAAALLAGSGLRSAAEGFSSR